MQMHAVYCKQWQQFVGQLWIKESNQKDLKMINLTWDKKKEIFWLCRVNDLEFNLQLNEIVLTAVMEHRTQTEDGSSKLFDCSQETVNLSVTPHLSELYAIKIFFV